MPPQEPQPAKKPLLKRIHRRFIWGVTLPGLVLISVFGGILLLADYPAGRVEAPQTERGAEHAADDSDTWFETPNGRRYASVEAIGRINTAHNLLEAHDALQYFLKQYDMQLHTLSVQPSAYVRQHDTFRTLEAADLAAFKAYAKVFVDEWAKYPRDWVKASNIKHLMIVKDLAVGDTKRAATPDPVGDALYYDIGYGAETYAREVIHHEYNHLIEYEHFYSYSRPDSAWRAINGPAFAYNPGGGVAAYHERAFTNDAHPLPGFVNRYATYGIEEDKAEVYAYLMTAHYYRDLTDWIKADEKLAQKVQRYKDFMRSVSPEMNDAYFTAINP